MAQRDRSQGFGFVYMDVSKLLKQKNEDMPTDFQAPIDTESLTVANFNKDTNRTLEVSAEQSDYVRSRATAMQQIRTNLDRLQSLHHKLHAMLAELNSLTGEKKKG